MMAQQSHPVSHWLGLGALVVFWGSSFAMTKLAVASVSPAFVVSIRLWVAVGIIALLLAWRRELPGGGWAVWRWYALLGMMGNNIPFLLITWGTKHIDSGLAGILMGIVPLIVVSMAHFFVPGERMTPGKGFGFIIGFLGVIVLIGPSALLDISGSGMALIAQLAILLATLCYAAHTIVARLMPKQNTYQTTFGVLLSAALFSLPMAFVLSPHGLADASAFSVGMSVLLGIFPTALAGLVMFWLIRKGGPSFISLSNYLIPAFALAMGVLFMNESLSWSLLAGFSLILFGIWVSSLRRRESF